MSKSMRRIAIVLGCTALMAGCAGMGVGNLKPQGTPDRAGLVLVEGTLVIKQEGMRSLMSFGKDDEEGIMFGQIAPANGGPVDCAVSGFLCDNVKPGHYRVFEAGYTQARAGGTYNIGYKISPAMAQQAGGLEFDVRAGQIVFVGGLTVRAKEGLMASSYETVGVDLKQPAPGAEKKALEQLRDRLDAASPWLSVINQRLKDIGG